MSAYNFGGREVYPNKFLSLDVLLSRHDKLGRSLQVFWGMGTASVKFGRTIVGVIYKNF